MTNYLEGLSLPLDKKSRGQLELEWRELKREIEKLYEFKARWEPFVDAISQTILEQTEQSK